MDIFFCISVIFLEIYKSIDLIDRNEFYYKGSIPDLNITEDLSRLYSTISIV